MKLPTIDEVRSDKQFKSINRELTDDERKALRESIKLDGVQDAVRAWHNGEHWLLVDGYNRYELWRGEGGDPPEVKPVPKRLSSRNEVVNWLIDWQLARRNLNAQERKYLIGKRYNEEKKDRADNLLQGPKTSKNTEKSPKGQSGPSENTATRIATKTSSSAKSVKRAGKFAAAVDAIAENVSPKAADDIRSGKISEKDAIAIASLPAKEQPKAIAAAKLGKPVVAKIQTESEAIAERFSVLIDKALPKMIDEICGLDESLKLDGKLKRPAEALYSSLFKLLKSFKPK